eukprot:TRINITY_DN1648_c1_g2_i1.p1 TRINITY_DN1648_c1_g2~~TRINITY_DN1648_c1_g2_i1.p1  ORF type:complete len:876 (+),score=106.12 TRINITY_DN1648_c1_g2_i1:212-2839(+)
MNMNPMLDKKDDDEGYIPFQGLEKGTVLQEKRLFNESPLNPRKCCMLLTKVLYLLVQGETFTTNEATDLFFSVTKLFQSKDVNLRRMVYLMLKDLLPLVDDTGVIIVISCLTKDMNSKIDLYRANAIRVLCKINDISMLGQAERYLKQAIVDKEPYVASAALVSGVHLMRVSPAGVDLVKRWFSEIQNAVKSKAVMVQYHALGLHHQIKHHDRLAVSRLVSEMTRSPVRSHYAHCLLIRFTCQVMEDEEDPSERARLYEYLESCVRHKSDTVIYEAARGICAMRNVTSKELAPAIAALQLFLSSPKPTLRFAAVRTLNKVAMTHPLHVATCNMDMENLIGDANRSIATLAITTLLKTGSESSVDRLMKQISNFMNEISDESKIVVVDAIKTLCLKYKQKHRMLMNFLSNMLRDEGGYLYKKAIVDTILLIISALPEAKEAGLSHLCEFIEDCEFTGLSTKILHLLGREGPSTSCPSKYIRYIYNRVILENANIRASAVTALACFAVSLPDQQKRILVLLQRCLHDNDDEVRDRATFYYSLLKTNHPLARQHILEGFAVSLPNLERALLTYKANPSSLPFDISSVPAAPEPEIHTKATPTSGFGVRPAASTVSAYAEALQQIPEFASLGALFRSTKSVELTESETEYVVNCVKHIFAEHVVFQFNCTNTIKDQLLEEVSVKMDASNAPGLQAELETSADSLPYQVPGVVYVCMRHDPENFPVGRISNTLKFSVRDVDAATGKPDGESYEDEYQLEDLEVGIADYVKRTPCADFKERWEALGDEAESRERYTLSTVHSIKDAITQVCNFLGMQPVDKTDEVPPKKSLHELHLSGTVLPDVPVLARVRMGADPSQGVNMQVAVRSTHLPIAQALASAL